MLLPALGTSFFQRADGADDQVEDHLSASSSMCPNERQHSGERITTGAIVSLHERFARAVSSEAIAHTLRVRPAPAILSRSPRANARSRRSAAAADHLRISRRHELQLRQERSTIRDRRSSLLPRAAISELGLIIRAIARRVASAVDEIELGGLLRAARTRVGAVIRRDRDIERRQHE